ncbi:beta-defensin 135 [Callospermophilus lateralis]|uniref:beta-defensin 135 n=1 Tax=Callospermophilus lateralis TaxID=76772 RepID=UPI0040537E41
MRNLLLVLVVLVLLSYVPPVRSGPNAYIRQLFSTCWRLKGGCKKKCSKDEVFHILCDNMSLCCVSMQVRGYQHLTFKGEINSTALSVPNVQPYVS